MSLGCADLEALAAELALGTVAGAERAAALDHLAGCQPCRELVDQLARVADAMLLLAPVRQPPPGFESSVLARIGVAAPAARRLTARRRILVGVAAGALVVGLATAGAAWLAGADRPVAEAAVRTALASSATGTWTCRALVYGHDPTWLVVSLDRTDTLSASFSVEAVHDGAPAPVPVGTLTIERGHGTLAAPVAVPAGDLRMVRVRDAGGQVRYEMTFPPA